VTTQAAIIFRTDRFAWQQLFKPTPKIRLNAVIAMAFVTPAFAVSRKYVTPCEG
jgi:hypothetical protein